MSNMNSLSFRSYLFIPKKFTSTFPHFHFKFNLYLNYEYFPANTVIHHHYVSMYIISPVYILHFKVLSYHYLIFLSHILQICDVKMEKKNYKYFFIYIKTNLKLKKIL